MISLDLKQSQSSLCQMQQAAPWHQASSVLHSGHGVNFFESFFFLFCFLFREHRAYVTSQKALINFICPKISSHKHWFLSAFTLANPSSSSFISFFKSWVFQGADFHSESNKWCNWILSICQLVSILKFSWFFSHHSDVPL